MWGLPWTTRCCTSNSCLNSGRLDSIAEAYYWRSANGSIEASFAACYWIAEAASRFVDFPYLDSGIGHRHADGKCDPARSWAVAGLSRGGSCPKPACCTAENSAGELLGETKLSSDRVVDSFVDVVAFAVGRHRSTAFVVQTVEREYSRRVAGSSLNQSRSLCCKRPVASNLDSVVGKGRVLGDSSSAGCSLLDMSHFPVEISVGIEGERTWKMPKSFASTETIETDGLDFRSAIDWKDNCRGGTSGRDLHSFPFALPSSGRLQRHWRCLKIRWEEFPSDPGRMSIAELFAPGLASLKDLKGDCCST